MLIAIIAAELWLPVETAGIHRGRRLPVDGAGDVVGPRLDGPALRAHRDGRCLACPGVFTVEIFDCPLRKIGQTRVIYSFRERLWGLGTIEITPQDETCPSGLWQTVPSRSKSTSRSARPSAGPGAGARRVNGSERRRAGGSFKCSGTELARARCHARWRMIAPLVWRVGPLGPGVDPPLTILSAAIATGGWVFLPADVPDADLGFLKAFDSKTIQRPSIVMGVRGEDLAAQRAFAPVRTTGRDRRDKLCGGHPGRGRSHRAEGRPAYQRLTQLRDAGVTRLIFLEATDVPNAEWLIENTAAHAVSLPFGVADLTAAYGLLDIAQEVGTAVLVRRPERVVWNATSGWDKPTSHVPFCLSDPRVAAVIEPLPDTEERLRDLLVAAASLVSDDVTGELWAAFQQQVPRPPRSRTGHPPEYGA